MDSHVLIQFVGFAILAILMFVILQPGNLFTIPGDKTWISYKISETNKSAVIVHTLLYTLMMGSIIILYANVFSRLIQPLLPNPQIIIK